MHPLYTPPPAKALIFLHNSRCGGNSVNNILAEEFGTSAIFKLGQVGDTYYCHEDFIHAAEKGSQSLFLGHFCFGAHKFIPRPAEYFMCIRAPLSRVWSSFKSAMKPPGTTLRKFVEDDFDSTNGMVKRLCGFGFNDSLKCLYDFASDRPLPADFEPGKEHLDLALKHVEEWSPSVLFQEYMEESLLLLERHYQCRPLFSMRFQRFNQTPSIKLEEAVDTDTVRWLERRNALDSQFYDALSARFHWTLSAQDQGYHDRLTVMKIISRIGAVEGQQVVDQELFLQRFQHVVDILLDTNQTALIIELFLVLLTKPKIPKPYWKEALGIVEKIGSNKQYGVFEELLRSRFPDEA